MNFRKFYRGFNTASPSLQLLFIEVDETRNYEPVINEPIINDPPSTDS